MSQPFRAGLKFGPGPTGLFQLCNLFSAFSHMLLILVATESHTLRAAPHLTPKCLIQIRDKIFRAFQAHGEPQQRLR